jgi:ABC-2 type transport system ATP-binding protein
MTPIISISNLTKTYASGHKALKRIDLEIRKGEIFALLGPNGAGKTTLISIVCGIVTPTDGVIVAAGHDIRRDYRSARAKIGLVPQEISTDAFESVSATVSFSRGLFGFAPNPGYIDQLLRELSLWDKRQNKIMTLSGGMKRRVMIAKALAHEPQILFLDEPSAGVDVELILVEEKTKLMKKLGKKQLTLNLLKPLAALPLELSDWRLALNADGTELEYTFDADDERAGIPALLQRMTDLGIRFKDLNTRQSSLEDIFISLVGER